MLATELRIVWIACWCVSLPPPRVKVNLKLAIKVGSQKKDIYQNCRKVNNPSTRTLTDVRATSKLDDLGNFNIICFVASSVASQVPMF
jgi:hypothetical protein